MIDTTTIKEYHIICNRCKKFFFKISYAKIKMMINDLNLIDNILYYFNKKNWISIINLSVLSIYKNKNNKNLDIDENEYDLCISKARLIMMDKNLDYGDIWRKLDISSIEDIILQKIFRIKNMNSNIEFKILDNYIDILNYSVFILIKIS
ncbi:DUF1599 domain-containing protein [Blattabacterium cuenoti]|uniref:DUF1599 domain-containing protein n=1 Tax=Blattabacterium cuenoti TaxID=1653831 RepID=UPI00163BBCC2|nr:DUF1599 domain-containing protein [Blattabacterium cuenoti]